MIPNIDLSLYNKTNFSRGRSRIVEVLWNLIQAMFVSSFIPGSLHRTIILRMFGASIGNGVIIRPRVRIKFPWRLNVGENSWIGEGVWIDNLVNVSIGSNCCISQDSYICTGSHDWASEKFDLITREIIINDFSWIGAQSSVGPGTIVGKGVVLTIGSVALGDLNDWLIYQGNPAKPKCQRIAATQQRELLYTKNI